MAKRFLTFIGNALLILAAVFCTTGIFTSAFSITVDTRILYPVWLIAALALPALAALWRGKGLLLLLPPALLILILRWPEIINGAKWTVFHITTEYNKWLHVPVIFPGSNANVYAVTLFFTIAGISLTFLLSIAICLRRSASLTAFFTVPPVFLTFILTETRPDDRFLLGLVAVILALILSSALHPDDFIKRGTAVFPALVITAIILSVTYFTAHPDNHMRSGRVMNYDAQIRDMVQRAGFALNKTGYGWPEVSSGIWRFNTERVPVSDAGSRIISDQSILRINADHAGTFYLKGYSMQSFDGREWRGNSDTRPHTDEALSNIMPLFIVWAYSSYDLGVEAPLMNMTITKTGDSSDILYRPYYSPAVSGGDPYDVEFVYTEESVPQLLAALPSAAEYFGNIRLRGYNTWVRASSVYTEINAETARELLQIARDVGIDPNDDREVIAESVAKFISSSGRYTLSPYIIPEGEDFALYFLKTSKRGYCIHFATAATLMLRALDVPARFTSGFVATVPVGSAGRDVVVTDRHAHAWVEVYYDDVGWIPLEVTPPATGLGTPGAAPGTSTAIGSGGYQGGGFDDMYDEDDLYNFFPSTPTSLPGAGLTVSESPGPASIARRNIIIILCIVACVLLLLLHWYFARKYREKRFAQTNTNAAVIFAWRFISRLDRHVQQPKEIEELALKARFSQHTISEDERAAMIEHTRSFSARTYNRHNKFGRFWIKLIRGL